MAAGTWSWVAGASPSKARQDFSPPPTPRSTMVRRLSRRLALALSVLGILWIAALLLFFGTRRKLDVGGPEEQQTPKVGSVSWDGTGLAAAAAGWQEGLARAGVEQLCCV